MHTNVNFLMWAAVTVLLVFASLLLGLFWGKEKDTGDRALRYPQLAARASHFCVTEVSKGRCQATIWKTAVAVSLPQTAVRLLDVNVNQREVQTDHHQAVSPEVVPSVGRGPPGPRPVSVPSWPPRASPCMHGPALGPREPPPHQTD